MKKIILLVCLVFVFSRMNAQNWTTNTTCAILAANTYGPMNSTNVINGTNRTAVIYPASQLNALSGKLLTSMYFERNTASGVMSGNPNFKIYLKEVSNTDWGSAAIDWTTTITGATLVFDGSPITNVGSTAGWKSFPLTAGFTYSGTQNLAVITEYNNPTTSSTNITWNYDYVSPCVDTANNNTTKYSTNTTGVFPTSLGSTNYRRPRIGFDFPSTCPAPSSLTATGATSNSINLGWVINAPATEWAYVIQPQGTGYPTGSGTQIFAQPHTVGGLNSATNYEVYLRSNCGVGDNSFWLGPINFTTLCAPVTTFPILEPFNAMPPNMCWIKGDNGDLSAGPSTVVASSWVADGFANSGITGAARFTLDSNSDNDWLISPQISIPASGYELKFDVAATQGGTSTALTVPWETDDFIEVLVSTAGMTSWTSLYTYNNSNVPSNAGSTNIIDLDIYAGQTIRLAYRAVEGAVNGTAFIDFFVDNFEVRLSPTCTEPIGLTAGNVTGTTADLSWNSVAGSNGYEYVINTNVADPASSGTFTTNNLYSASGLSGLTTYYLHVRTDCGAGVFSPWVSISFTTLCTPISVYPHLEPFNVFVPNICWREADNGDLIAGPLSFDTGSWAADGFANNGTSGAIKINIDTATDNDWVISPQFIIPTTGYELKFNAAATQVSTTTAPTIAWEADDFVEILVSTTATTDWTVLYTYNSTNVPSPAGVLNFIDLDALSGQTVRFAFRGVEGTSNGNASVDFFIDDFEVRLSPTCAQPIGLVVGNVTGTSADFSWDTVGGAAGYEFVINTNSGNPAGSGTFTVNNFYIASGLTELTTYYLHVRTDCGSGDFSTWSTISFTTGCASITTFPYLEPFNTFLPSVCWTEGDNGNLTTGPAINGSGSWVADGFGNVGTTGAAKVILDGALDNDWLISPIFAIPTSGYELKYYAAATQGSATTAPTTAWESDDFVEVLVSNTNMTNWSVLYTYNDVNAPLNTGSVSLLDLDAYAGQNVRFAFRAVEGASDGSANIDFSIDNFELRLSPSCADLTGIVFSGITSSDANFSWDNLSGFGVVSYEYALTSSVIPPASGTSTFDTYYVASGLLPQTVYYLHVRSNCGSGNYGAWSTISFTTLPTPPANDNLCNATALTLGTPTGITNTLAGATVQTSEPVGSCFNVGVNGSVWFSFVAPSSGTVEVTTDFAGGTLGNGNTEIAVYAATGVTCADLSTLGTQLGCDQDGGTTVNLSSVLSLSGLVSNATYYIQVDRFGNVAPGTFGIKVSEVLSSNTFNATEFVAYPNPVKDILNLSYETPISNLKVTNLLGQEVLNMNVNTNEVKLDISFLTSGTYIMNITIDKIIHTIKLIKE